MRIGSDAHLTLLCREFIDTHDPFEPAKLPWPDLDAASVAKLRGLPFWDEAIRTERRTGAKVTAYAAEESPALLREAVALQGFEEMRHAALLDALVRRYDIRVDPGPEQPLPPNLEAAFTRTGYGECIDSFFAFGMFALARETEFLPHALLGLLEPIVQEEVRHILFLVNWVAYKRRQRAALLRPLHRLRCLAAFAGAAFDRVRSAGNVARDASGGTKGGAPAAEAIAPPVSKDGFTASGASAIAGDFSVRAFVALCLRENARRFAAYAPELLRPRAVPAMARAFLAVTSFGRPIPPLTSPAA
ncbi:MAG: ferritin-like domain-containing protein [Deltaproteobacteria bacterium]|nr:ferritin-like domain-containing protein [Deltaproteobacteria bacterium]